MFFIRAHGGGGFSIAATFCCWLELLRGVSLGCLELVVDLAIVDEEEKWR